MATKNLGLEPIELSDDIKTSMLIKMNENFEKIDEAYETLKTHLLAKTGKTTLSAAIDYVDQLVNANDATATTDKIFKGYTAYKGLTKLTGTALSTTTTVAAGEILTGKTCYNNAGTLITGTMVSKAGVQQAASSTISGNNYVLKIPVAGYYTTGSWLTRAKTSVISDLGIKVTPTINVTLTGGSTALTGYISGYGAAIDNNGVLVIWAMSNSTAYEHIYFVNSSIGAGTIGNGWNITSWATGDPASVPYACTVTGLGSYSTINVGLYARNNNTSYDYVQIDVTLTAS